MHSSAAAVHLQHMQATASPLLINDAYSKASSSAARDAQMELGAVFCRRFCLRVSCVFFCLLHTAPTRASHNFITEMLLPLRHTHMSESPRLAIHFCSCHVDINLTIASQGETDITLTAESLRVARMTACGPA
jgi:hypothetical protein